MARMTAEEANRRLAQRLGVAYDPLAHVPSHGAEYDAARPVPPSPPASPTGLTEADTGGEPSSASGSGWRLLGDRVTQRRTDLSLMDQQKMIRLALKLWDTNPLAQRLIKRMVHYVLGEGLSLRAKHEDDERRKAIQDVLDRTWNDHRNRLSLRLPRWLISYRAMGELCINTTVNPATGLVRFAVVSPLQIVNVFTEREDAEQVEFVAVGQETISERMILRAVRVVEQPERWLESGERALQELARADYDPDKSDWGTIARLSGEDQATGPVGQVPGKIPRRQGKCFYFGANTLPGMVRGRSDLLAVADFVDAYDRLAWLSIERRSVINAFVWDVTLQGGTPEEIAKWLADNGPPEPGTVRVHNEREKWEAVTPTLGTQDESVASDLLLSTIATGVGFPRHWLGGQDDPNRASAVEMTTPTMKDMAALQLEFAHIIEEMFRFVVDQAVMAGVLPPDTESDCFDVVMPEMSPSDTVKAASSLQSLTASMVALIQAGVIDVDEAQALYALTVPGIGHEPDLEKMRDRLEKAKAEQKKQDDGADAYGPGGPKPPPGLQRGAGNPETELGDLRGEGNPSMARVQKRAAAALNGSGAAGAGERLG